MATSFPPFASRHPRISYYTALGLAVAVCFAGVNAWLIATGREGVWTQDAQPLYVNFLVWGCQALSDAIEGLSSGDGFALPLYTYSMGYGADVPMTMGSYLQDPINIIVACLPRELVGVSYPLMTLARMVLAAYAFSWYCLGRGNTRKASFVASLAYATCGFVILLGAFRHPKFIDWAILLPLILKGADRLFEGKGPGLLIASLFCQFIVSIYFSYMSCVVLVLYCLIKYFAAPRNRSVGDFAKLVCAFVGCGVLAFLLSGAFSVHQIVALLSQGRATSGATAVPLLFSIKYYAKVAAHFIGAAGTTDGMLLGGVSTIGLLAYCLCGKRFADDARRAWLIGLAICIVGVLVPFLSHVINGMGYSTDRWMLVLAFVSSYLLCRALPTLSELDASEWKRITRGAGVFVVLTLAYGLAQLAMPDGVQGMVWPVCMACVFALVFVVLKRVAAGGSALRLTATAAASIIVCASLAATFYCSPFGQNWGSTFPKIGTTWENISAKSPAAAVEQLGDAGAYRYTLPRVFNSMKNSPLAHGLMGIDYYTSYYNQNVDDFRQELGISDHHMNFSFVGSDSRLAVEDFTGAKYYVCKSRDFWRVPYGFEDTGIEYRGFHVFENPRPVPLAFLAPDAMDYADYRALSMTQKQEALLQSAIVDLESLPEQPTPTHPELASREISYEMKDLDGLEVDGDVVRVLRKGAHMTLAFEGLDKAETYLSFENLSYSGYSPSEQALANGNQLGVRGTIQDLLWSETTTYPIKATVGEHSKTIDPATPRHLRYGGKVDWIFNLGYAEAPVTQMTLTFDATGEYRFDAMKVVCQPIAPIVSHAEELAQGALGDLSLETNRISAKATLEDDVPRIAVFTFAYTPGWTVAVDGEPAQVLRTSTAFLGVELSGAGTHEIVWSYETPGLRVGAAMSLAGVIAALVLALVLRLRRG